MKRPLHLIHSFMLLLIFTLTMPELQVSAASTPPVEQEAVLLGVKAGSTLKVTSATDEMAEKIHALLIQNKSVVLKVKGDKTASKKIVKELQRRIGTVNMQGIIFQHDGGKQNKSYYNYTIKEADAKLYNYSIKTSKMIFDKVMEDIKGDIEAREYDKAEYEYLNEHYGDCEGMRSSDIISYKLPGDDSENTLSVWMWLQRKKSCEENGELEELEGLCKKAINLQQGMSNVSDAMKVWVVDYSAYFDCTRSQWYNSGYFKSWNYGMRYFSYSKTSYFDFNSDWKRMKALATSTAAGVCEDFARYEVLLFQQWGISAYVNRSGKLNHAWSVVKAKNSDGKLLWIPFDYGIGPCVYLKDTDYSQTYIKTEAVPYKLYLSGIKGAPSKKNFTMEDFY